MASGFTNPDTQPLPALIIGLGGSGAWALVQVKQQLFETFNNRIPENISLVSFDTLDSPNIRVSGVGNRREVALDPKEYGFLGGNVKEFMRRTASGEHPHLDKWLLADWYLRNLPDNLFQLNAGAGQYRQFGRLALFRDVAAPAQSRLYNLLSDKLNYLRNYSRTATTLSVYIIGSITGGTGAGLFIDVAHLVRQIARQTAGNLEIVTRGFFFLPEAFRGVLHAANLEQSLPRSFGALREMRRFLLNQDWKYGYPMHYMDERAVGDEVIWRGTVQNKLYDLVYLIDGIRDYNALNNVPLPQGSAASVADAIMAYIDPHTGSYQREYVVNLSNQAAEMNVNYGASAYVGGLGTYSIVLPIEHVVESWSHRLAFTALQHLNPIAETDADGMPTRLNPVNKEKPSLPDDEAFHLLTRGIPVPNPENAAQTLKLTALWRKLYEMAYAQKEENSVRLNSFANYGVDDWLSVITPESTDADRHMLQLIQMNDRILRLTVAESVPTGDDMKPKEDHTQGYRRVDNEARKFMDRQIGVLMPTGSREGGLYRDALYKFTDAQFNRFQQVLVWYTHNMLNSLDPTALPIDGKSGKLAWLIAVYEEIRGIVAGAAALLDRLNTQQTATAAQRAQATELINDMARQMRAEAEGNNRRKAYRAQTDFISAADQYMDIIRAEVARDALMQFTQRVRDFLDGTLSGLYRWQDVLALSTDSLYTQILKGTRRLEYDLARANDVNCRKIIGSAADSHEERIEQEWYTERYNYYLSNQSAGTAIDLMMQSFKWEISPKVDAQGGSSLSIGFRVGGNEIVTDGRGDWQRDNQEALLNACRAYFQAARREESVFGYLMNYLYPKNPQGLAQLLYENSGALLDFDPTAARMAGVLPTSYLIAYHNPEQPAQKLYLEDVLQHIRQLGGRGGETSGETTDKMQTSENRFRLTVLSMTELIPLNSLSVTRRAEEKYLAQNWEARQKHHIFGAEVNAVKFEQQIQYELREEQRLLKDRVCILLEDYDLFREFLFLMAHGIIYVDRDEIDQTNANFVYYLVAPDKDRPDHMATWWLTEPSKDPSLLDAMVTYIFHKEDIGQRVHSGRRNYRHEIDYAGVREFLVKARREDAATRWLEERIDTGEVGLTAHLRGFDEDDERHKEIRQLISYHDMLRELQSQLSVKLRGDLTEKLAQARQRDEITQGEAAQELYDLYSVAIVALDEEARAYVKDIENRAATRIDSDRQGRGRKLN